MMETHEFLMPEYFPSFRCKMGACRHSCCEGWSVTVSLEDYYRLLNVDMSDELRRRVSDALRPLQHPTPDEYAEIAHDYTGRCRLHMEDGRCALHAMAGEKALSPLCRLYPRGIRGEDSPECSCALSCEATVEQLWEIREPLKFIRREMTLEVPEGARRSVRFETFGHEQELRLFFIRLMQDRRYPLSRRLAHLSAAVADAEDAINAADEARITALLSRDYGADDPAAPAEKPADFALSVAERFAAMMEAHSEALKEYGAQAYAYFSGGEGIAERHAEAAAKFERRFPDWERLFEHLLVNHMFFGRFPFQDRPDSLCREKSALDAVYCLLRFTALGCAAEGSREDLVDVCRAVFRLADHTAFDSYAGALLEQTAREAGENIEDLLSL